MPHTIIIQLQSIPSLRYNKFKTHFLSIIKQIVQEITSCIHIKEKKIFQSLIKISRDLEIFRFDFPD